MNVNKVILGGRIVADPDIKIVSTGQKLANFVVATNNIWKNKAGEKQDKAEFHNVTLWGKLAEVAEKYAQKGSEVFIEGRIQYRNYKTTDGTDRRATDIIGESFQIVSGRKQTEKQFLDLHQGDNMTNNPIVREDEFDKVLSDMPF